MSAKKKDSAPADAPRAPLQPRSEAAISGTHAALSSRIEHDVTRLMHELNAHRKELEVQNEQLVKAQEELALSERRYQELYDEAPVGYLTLDREGRIHQANRRASELLGGGTTRIDGRTLVTFTREPDASTLRSHLEKVFSAGGKHVCEVALHLRGRRIPLRIDSVAFEAGEDRKACRSTLIDLSELRRAELRFRRIADHVRDAFFVRERKSGQVYANPAFEKAWGEPAADPGGVGWMDRIVAEDRARLVAAHERFLGGLPFDEECRATRRDGTLAWIRVRMSPIVEADALGAVDVCVIQDVTAEHKLQHAQKAAAVGALASTLAEDFNEVLRSVLDGVDGARDPATPPERAREYLERAADAAQRGAELSGQVSTLAGKGEISPGPIAVDSLLRSLEGGLNRFLTRQVTLTLETRAPGAVILADAIQIRQLVLTLAATGRDAMPNGGRVRIASSLVGAPPRFCLTVEDSGSGIDEPTRRRLFEPFFNTRETHGGVGLGLSTVLDTVRDLGGTMSVESEPGKGTRFVLVFPCFELTERPRTSSPKAARRPDRE